MSAQRPQPSFHSTPNLLSLLLPLPLSSVKTYGNSVALVGAKGCEKRSLLMQAAVRLVNVSDADATVLFLSADKITHKPHAVHHMPAITRDTPHRVIIHYFSSSGDLIKFLADYHRKGSCHRGILIDGLHRFAERKFLFGREYEPQAIAGKILALARELSFFFHRKSSNTCYLLIGTHEQACMRPAAKVASTAGDPSLEALYVSLLPTLNTFVENVVRIKRDESSELPGRTHYRLTFDRFLVCFYVQERQIFLDRLEEEMQVPPAAPAAAEAVTG